MLTSIKALVFTSKINKTHFLPCPNASPYNNASTGTSLIG